MGSFLCTDGHFLNNISPVGGAIFGFDNFHSSIIFRNNSFFNNSAENSIVSILNTNLTFQNCIFLNNVNNLFLLESSNIILNQSSIENHSFINQQYGCLVNEILFSNIYIIDSILNNVNSLKGGLFFCDYCNLFLQKSLFKYLKSNDGVGPLILSYFSNISSLDTSFQIYDFNLFFLKNGSLLIINNSFMNENQTIQSNSKLGTIYCDSCQNSYINQSFFSGNKNSAIGAIAFYSSNDIKLNNSYINIFKIAVFALLRYLIKTLKSYLYSLFVLLTFAHFQS